MILRTLLEDPEQYMILRSLLEGPDTMEAPGHMSPGHMSTRTSVSPGHMSTRTNVYPDTCLPGQMSTRTKMPGHVLPGHMFPGQLGLQLSPNKFFDPSTPSMRKGRDGGNGKKKNVKKRKDG